MPTTDRILTWNIMTAEGIDADRITRETNAQDTSLEMYRALSADGRTSLLFGEYWDRAEGGWDAMEYEDVRDSTDDGPVWEPTDSPQYFEAPADVVTYVREWLDRNIDMSARIEAFDGDQNERTYAVLALCSYRSERRRYDVVATSPAQAAEIAADRYGHESTIGVDTDDVNVIHLGIVR